jgi:molybdopterin/thiamine biosynthesis adenylyltransferase
MRFYTQTKVSTAALLPWLPLGISLERSNNRTLFYVTNPLHEKYSRQMLFAGIGSDGQERLLASKAVIVGCGAIGAAAANLLVRAGVGHLRIIDRDFVEPSNLQRQTLFEESDARNSLPKAVAAERRLHAINSSVRVEGIVADLNSENVQELLADFPLILDGTDNFETRFLINDFAVRTATPWIYGAAVASYGLTLAIRPAQTACLACLLEPAVGAGLEETCDTVGVLGSIVNLIASLQVAEALKILSGRKSALHGHLISADVWSGHFQSIAPERNPDCRACVHRSFSYLQGDAQPHITMCGRDSVQIHERSRTLDLKALQERLSRIVSDARCNDFLLRFRVSPYELTVFSDGRAIIQGTTDPAVARSLYAKYLGA